MKRTLTHQSLHLDTFTFLYHHGRDKSKFLGEESPRARLIHYTNILYKGFSHSIHFSEVIFYYFSQHPLFIASHIDFLYDLRINTFWFSLAWLLEGVSKLTSRIFYVWMNSSNLNELLFDILALFHCIFFKASL